MKIKWTADFADEASRKFTIVPTVLRNIATHEQHTEYYLYIQDRDGRDTHDYMQETLEKTKSFAQKKFGVPLDAWTENQDVE